MSEPLEDLYLERRTVQESCFDEVSLTRVPINITDIVNAARSPRYMYYICTYNHILYF